MSCQDDAQFMGPVSLFAGIESYNWSIQDFIACANFAKQHGISTLIIKVAEAGGAHPDIWYGGIAGWDVIYQKLKSIINILTYQFCYGGSNLSRDIDIATQFLTKYGTHCLDIEGTSWEGDTAASQAQQFGQVLSSIPGKLWLSHPSDFTENNQQGAIGGFALGTNVFMPMVYSSSLAAKGWMQEIESVNCQPCVQPTLDLSQEFGPNDPVKIAQQCKDAGCLAVSLWEYEFAQTYPQIVDQIVQLYGGGFPSLLPPPPVVGGNMKLDSSGCVVTVTRSNQLMEGEPDLCGPWSAYAVAFGYLPGGQSQTNANTIDESTDQMVQDVFNVTPASFGGVVPSDMISIFEYIKKKWGRIHYWVIDGKNIPLAIKAGYPCLFSCNEKDIEYWNGNGWAAPYDWNISASHVIPVTGLDNNGNWICPDQLSSRNPWPVIYNASKIQNSLSWAAIIQVVGPDHAHPWLASIPSGDPTNWPAGFNAQDGGTTTPPQPAVDYQKQQADTIWGVIPTGTGIYQAWLADFRNGVRHGPPIGIEIHSVDWNGQPVILQLFAGALARWPGDGKAYWYPWG